MSNCYISNRTKSLEALIIPSSRAYLDVYKHFHHERSPRTLDCPPPVQQRVGPGSQCLPPKVPKSSDRDVPLTQPKRAERKPLGWFISDKHEENVSKKDFLKE